MHFAARLKAYPDTSRFVSGHGFSHAAKQIISAGL